MKSKMDLHMHSLFSDDGEYTPSSLVEMCARAGIRVLSITDHNGVRANEEAKREAQRRGMTYLSGVEMDCTYLGLNLHVLGYGINERSPDFEEVENNITRQSAEASHERLRLTRQALGFSLSGEELNAISGKEAVWTGEVFAELLLGKEEYGDSEILKPYREGGARSDNPYVNFYWDYYAQGKPCYVPMRYPSFGKALEIIRANGGRAVLAHPGVNLKGRFSLFDEMVSLGLDGVEAFSSYHDPETAQYFYGKGREHHLLITCGSDFHGKTKPSIHLGECGCPIDLTAEFPWKR